MHYAVPIAIKDHSPTGEFCGYGAIFSTTDLGGDAIQPNAFHDSIASIKARDAPLPVLLSHDPSKPVGRFTLLQEDRHGLFVEGKLTLETRAAKEAYALMRDRAVSGLSIGYDIPQGGSEYKNGIRLLHKLDLIEISLTPCPMHPDARISQVKMLDCTDQRDLRNFLHHEHSLSRSKAARVAETVWPILHGEDADDAQDIEQLSIALKLFNTTLIGK